MLLPRDWIESPTVPIPHFFNVVKNVNKNEGVEITMNCNPDAFDWIIEVVKIKTKYPDVKGSIDQKFEEINANNCLNKLVTSYFL